MTNFVEKISRHIVKWCSGNELPEEETEVLVYGYCLLLENVYKLVFLLLVALFTGTLWQSLLILGSLVLLRSFAGGVHCTTSLGCTAIMVAVWGLGLVVSWIEIPVPVLILMTVVIVWTILRYAPQCTANNPITDPLIRKRKRIGAIVVMIILLAGGIVAYIQWNRHEILNMVLTSMLVEAFSILILVEKEEKDYEDDKPEEGSSKAW